ncbi:type IVB secretion system protein IcmH/DotU [uncultured Pseudomonas sp.]|uniref:type IVB secretion system protein IcmH/DotU n=1 Tax=uncultured Pseudomonas sp. TaxID=114707 RepID=UPI0025DAFD58|nr:type IVB secretion system protein IcmH/DotU [uncultured Pseudomonas sp.]
MNHSLPQHAAPGFLNTSWPTRPLTASSSCPPGQPEIPPGNALVAAAMPLLSGLVRIRYDENEPAIDPLNAQLRERLRDFERQALHAGADGEQVETARYLLCTVLDEAVLTTSWGRHGDWAQHSLLSHFHNETFGGDRFFHFLEQLSKDPLRNLPLLELSYLCLALGFEGRYRVQPGGAVELEQVRDALYRQIRHWRGDPSGELSVPAPRPGEQPPPALRIVPRWLVALFTAVGLSVLYAGFAWVLGEQRDSVVQQWQAQGLILDEKPQGTRGRQ